MDYILIDALFVRCKHGSYKHERRVEQEFEIATKLGFEAAVAGKTDKLADAIDYDSVREKIRNVIEGGSRFLLEKLGEDIIVQIFKDPRIQSVELTLRKPEVWKSGIPGVTIFRQRQK